MLQLATNNTLAVPPSDRGIAIVAPTLTHARSLEENLRPGDREELLAQGLAPYAVIRRSLKGSIWARTYLFQGRVAAMMGLGGMALGDIGNPWLLTSNVIEDVSPRAFLVEARKGVVLMLEMKPHLENHVLASYRKACRLLQALGFMLDDAAPYGPLGKLFCRFWMDR